MGDICTVRVKREPYDVLLLMTINKEQYVLNILSLLFTLSTVRQKVTASVSLFSSLLLSFSKLNDIYNLYRWVKPLKLGDNYTHYLL
jgi:hypothetical protein